MKTGSGKPVIAIKGSQYYRHKKTGELYRYLYRGIDAANEPAGRLMIVYADTLGKIYVRERQEFIDKFEPVNEPEAV